MLDEIRRLDWTPRSVHRRAREAAEATREIEQRTGRDAKESEVARLLNISLEEYRQVLRESSTARLFSIDQPDDAELHAVPDDNGISPLGNLEDDHFRDALAESIEHLPEREKLVMSLYYDDELNLREIGEILGVSESRVCQIHGQAMVRLRARLTDWIDG